MTGKRGTSGIVEVEVDGIAQKKRTWKRIERNRHKGAEQVRPSLRVTFVCTTLVWLCCTRES